MKTNELEKLLGTTKDTLRYYEKEELISPSRDDNGYRNYSHEDIRIIKNIIMLRSFDLSIEDIRRIFNNEISLNTCLNQKKEYLLKEIAEQLKTKIKIANVRLGKLLFIKDFNINNLFPLLPFSVLFI